jgi:glycosyltransferase involved in cell wall biosynthesis
MKALFNLAMCQSLARSHDLRVVAPVAWTDRFRHTPANIECQLPVTYPTYYFPPAVLRSHRASFMWWSLRRGLRVLASEWQPDLILSYWVHPDGEVARRLAREYRVPFVQMVGGSDVLLGTSDRRRWQQTLHTLRQADAVLTIGQHLADHVIAQGINRSRVIPIYRAVNVTRFRPAPQESARAALGLAKSAPIIVWVGRLVAVKGLDTLLSAIPAVRQVLPTAQLHLIGDGPLKGALVEQAAALDVSSAVHFQGAVAPEMLPAWYQAADATALPSLSEGVPNVLMESLACGTPFVASAVGSVPDFADGRFDRTVAPGDSAALAAALVDVLGRRTEIPRDARLPAFVTASPMVLEQVLVNLVTRDVAVAS